MNRDSKCTKCKLHEGVKTRCVWGEFWPDPKAKSAEIVVIGEAPGEEEDSLGRPFIGKSGKLLRVILEEVNLGKGVYITNVCKCHPGGNRTPTLVERRTCSAFLQSELQQISPKYIVLLGATAIAAFAGARSVRVGEYRNKQNWIDEQTGAILIATYHPAAALRTPALNYSIVDDLSRIKSKEFIQPEQVKITVVDQVKEAMIPKIMAFDLETTGINPFAPGEILCVAWSGKDNISYVTQNWQSFAKAIKKKKPNLIGHNVKFDLLWLRKFGLKWTHPVFDTMVEAHLCDENLPSKGLKYLASIHTGYGDYAKGVLDARSKGEIKSLDTDTLLRYCAHDAAATWRLHQVLSKVLKREGLERLFEEQMRVLSTVVDMESHGIQVNTHQLGVLKRQFKSRIAFLSKSISKMFPSVNLDSPKQLVDLLYNRLGLPVLKKTPKGSPSVDESTLTSLLERTKTKAQETLLNGLIERRGCKKTLSTYIEGLEEHLDGALVVHPSFNLCGTVTGRFSCNSPNLQNIPREGGSPIKTVFQSIGENLLIEADYSQLELRIGAFITRDNNLLSLLRGDIDLHSATASRLYGVDIERVSKDQRYLAKTINFGIFYGMGPKRLHEETKLPIKQAGEFIRQWYSMYPGVRTWLEKVEEELLSKGYVTNIFGRRRRLPVIAANDQDDYRHMIRQACNFPIQSAASDLTQMAMVLVGKRYPVVGNIHDAILVESSMWPEASNYIKDVMSNPTWIVKQFGYSTKFDLPFPVEIKVGQSWGEMEEI